MATTTSVIDYLEDTASRPKAAISRPPPSLVHAQPKSAEELAKIMTSSREYPSPVRPVGSGSAVTRSNQSASGTLVDMTCLDRVVAVRQNTVTVQAGVRLKDLAELLEQDGLELMGGCSDGNRTVGGAISSMTLGARLPGDGAQFASTVCQITLINGEGRKVEVSDKLPDLLTLMRMSQGLMGIIYTATLRIRPIRPYSISTTKVAIDEFVALIPNLLEANAAVNASLMPFRDKVLVELRYPDEDGVAQKALPRKLRGWASQAMLPAVARSFVKALPAGSLRGSFVDTMVEASHALGNLEESGSNAAEQTGRFKALVLDENAQNCAWFFTARQFPAVIAAYRKMATGHYRSNRFRCDLPTEVWRVNQDQYSLLSPSFDSSGFMLNLKSNNTDGWDDFLLEFADLAAHFKGVPSFNMTKGYKPGYASRVFGERLVRFCTMRERLDPKNRLVNQYFAEHLR